MNQTLTLGYSTCPNDTFIFYGLAHDLIDCKGINFKITLADVENLNQSAKNGIFDISKLSFAAIYHLQNKYKLLRSGAALGRGCGPLIVARPGFDINKLHLKKTRIAVPGTWTTAYMLLGLYLEKTPENAVSMTFDRIMPSLVSGDFDFGVIIHEGRFTYQKYGLISLIDLGEWWETKTSLPIPLGGIAIKKELGPEITEKIEIIIRKSLIYSFNNKNAADEYIKQYVQEMEPSVIQRHIDLYVNDFSIDIGDEGEKAINTLFEMISSLRDFKSVHFL
ncbi:1,4-dihydroxy-6-naphtoate synthase [Candidatus Magnetomoraceae bacterium gMMP-15]